MVVRQVAQRYAVAMLAFAAASVWAGIGLIRSCACLLVFLGFYAAMLLHQRRAGARERIAGRRQNRPRSGSHARKERELRDSARATRRRLRDSPPGVFDADQELDWDDGDAHDSRRKAPRRRLRDAAPVVFDLDRDAGIDEGWALPAERW